MKYKIHQLDGRFSYRKWFRYYIGFSSYMSNQQGPVNFNHALQWFIDTYGWSAEIRQWKEVTDWHTKSVPLMAVKGGWVNPLFGKQLPDICNPNWSWSNGYNDLRIYVATDAELAFFQLKHAQDSSK